MRQGRGVRDPVLPGPGLLSGEARVRLPRQRGLLRQADRERGGLQVPRTSRAPS